MIPSCVCGPKPECFLATCRNVCGTSLGVFTNTERYFPALFVAPYLRCLSGKWWCLWHRTFVFFAHTLQCFLAAFVAPNLSVLHHAKRNSQQRLCFNPCLSSGFCPSKHFQTYPNSFCALMLPPQHC